MTESIVGSGGRRRVLDFAKEFWGFLRVRKKFWLLPIVVIMGLFGGVLVSVAVFAAFTVVLMAAPQGLFGASPVRRV